MCTPELILLNYSIGFRCPAKRVRNEMDICPFQMRKARKLHSFIYLIFHLENKALVPLEWRRPVPFSVIWKMPNRFWPTPQQKRTSTSKKKEQHLEFRNVAHFIIRNSSTIHDLIVGGFFFCSFATPPVTPVVHSPAFRDRNKAGKKWIGNENEYNLGQQIEKRETATICHLMATGRRRTKKTENREREEQKRKKNRC